MTIAIKNRLKELETERSKLLSDLNTKRSKKKFLCSCCGKYHAIKDCVVIHTHWYTSPSGCTGGDYWNSGELQIICPTTDMKNRLLFNSDFKVDWSVRNDYAYSAEEQFKYLYMNLFKSVIEDYDKDNRKWINSYYIDENRKRFGLHVKGLDK